MPDKNSKNTNRLDKIYIEVNAVINNHHSSKISSYISRLGHWKTINTVASIIKNNDRMHRVTKTSLKTLLLPTRDYEGRAGESLLGLFLSTISFDETIENNGTFHSKTLHAEPCNQMKHRTAITAR